MASSNRHWPSMFKSKPCNTHHQWQHHDINQALISSNPACLKPPYTNSVGGCEERSPEPKPRWNPKPEQIRILEAIFNSGMVNPPRDEIRKIRTQLQEFGQVGDANVFYWFQNRKSRSKHKLRHLQNSRNQSPSQSTLTPPTLTNDNNIVTNHSCSSSSSSSSNKSSPTKATKTKTTCTSCTPNTTFSMGFANVMSPHDVSNSPTGSVNNDQQTYFQSHNNNSNEFPHEPFFFPVQMGNVQGSDRNFSQGFSFPHEFSTAVGPDCTNLLLREIVKHGDHHHHTKKLESEERDMVMMKSIHPAVAQLSYANHLNSSTTSTTPPQASTIHTTVTSSMPTTVTVPSPFNQIPGAGVEQGNAVGQTSGGARSTVFINDVVFEVPSGPFNVREAFGNEAVLIHSSGQPVLTNQWGVTLQPLQHNAFYYLI